jgi:hypothetical protein
LASDLLCHRPIYPTTVISLLWRSGDLFTGLRGMSIDLPIDLLHGQPDPPPLVGMLSEKANKEFGFGHMR